MKFLNLTFCIFSFFLLLLSCSKAEEKPDLGKNSVNKTESIHPDVKMVTVKGGKYLPFYGNDSVLVEVKDFLLDERPVTNAEYLDFVKKNPAWKRSNVKRIFADSTYLKDWQNDETLPKGAKLNAPVTFVSWFAAKAYAKSAGKRLPTLDEWEYVAMADEELANARKKPSYSDHIISLYQIKYREKNPVMQSKPNYWGVYNMFDLVWEWTEDFNSTLITSDSRKGDFDDKGLVCATSATNATDVLNYASFMRYAYRSSLKANYTVGNLGFRCAKDIKN